MLLALPLGELSPQVTERAHAVSLGTKVLSAVRMLSAAPERVQPLHTSLSKSLAYRRRVRYYILYTL